jgi:hypothetical protein
MQGGLAKKVIPTSVTVIQTHQLPEGMIPVMLAVCVEAVTAITAGAL